MYLYNICAAMNPLEGISASGRNVLVLLTSEELEKGVDIPGLERIIRHTPSVQGARACKAEFRHDCLCGTIITPRRTKDGAPIAFGYLLTEKWAVLCDDTGTARSAVQHLQKGNPQRELGVGGFFCEFLEWLIAKDLHHLQKLEDDMDQMEEQVLSGELDQFNSRMNALRKEIIRWLRYYTQLDDMVCEFQENETALFRDSELRMLHMAEKRIGRLDGEAQALREYSIQLRELFQAEIDHGLSSIVPGGRLVWDEFYQYAGIGVEVRVSGHHRCKRIDRGALSVDHEKKEILVVLFQGEGTPASVTGWTFFCVTTSFSPAFHRTSAPTAPPCGSGQRGCCPPSSLRVVR